MGNKDVKCKAEAERLTSSSGSKMKLKPRGNKPLYESLLLFENDFEQESRDFEQKCFFIEVVKSDIRIAECFFLMFCVFCGFSLFFLLNIFVDGYYVSMKRSFNPSPLFCCV